MLALACLLLDAPTAWDYTRDIATLILAIVSIVVAVLVYTYQQKQDGRAALESATQLARTTRLEWVRLLIIEPNRDYILKFFQRIESALQKVNHSHLQFDQQIEVASELDAIFREFDRHFLSYFDSISLLAAASPHRELVEKLQETLTVELDEFQSINYVDSHRRMVQHVITCRNKFLAALYALSFQE